MLAAKKEHLAIVQTLLDAKADPNIIDQVGSSGSTNHLYGLLYHIVGVFCGRKFCQHYFAKTVKVAAIIVIINRHKKKLRIKFLAMRGDCEIGKNFSWQIPGIWYAV